MKSHQGRVEIFSLLNFKRLAENDANHIDLLGDNRIMQYIERGLQTSDEEVLNTCIRTLELLTDNPKSCESMKKIDSLKENLKSLLERRFGVSPTLKSKADKLIRLLDGNAKPLAKEKLTWPRKVITLHVTGLHNGTRKELEDILTKKVKGVLTVLVDVEHQRCVVTMYSHIEPKILAEAIAESGFLNALQVVRNKKNQETLVPLKESTMPEASAATPIDLPQYLEEDDELPVSPQAVRSTRDFRVTASEWFLTTAGILQKSMYW